MDFSLRSGTAASQRTACLVVGVFDGNRLSETAAAIDKTSQGAIRRVLGRGDMGGKNGQTLMLHNPPRIKAERILLVGLGARKDLDLQAYRKALAAAAATLAASGAKDALLSVHGLPVKDLDEYWLARHAIEVLDAGLYRYDETKSKKDKRPALMKVSLLSPPSHYDIERGIQHGTAVAHGVALTRDLANLPGNICTPTYLANKAKEMAKSDKRLTVRILEEAEMKKLGMGSLLSVSRGSRQPAKLIVFEYKGGKKGERPHALVGKGLTFDTGGISLKPGAAMDEMKYDMCGGASVFGTMRAITELGLPVNVVGVVPSSENMPDGDASKPGDIVTSMSGQTIEVLNTDAEGRLILCDALTWTGKTFKPKTVVDIATLTGAVVIALGKHATGLLGNDEPLADHLLACGRKTGDRAWQLPLWPEYDRQLKSNFADMANIGGREAGTITAACFLARFTRDMRWAHLDIAGTAYLTGSAKGATGRPVSLLVQHLIEQA